MHFSRTKMTPCARRSHRAIAMFAAVISSFIISGRSNDGDVVIVSDPAAFEIAVEVRGAVQTPGVYRLSQDARLDELLIAAGGANADADLAPHNLARRLDDAEVVVIERIGPATPVVAEATQRSSAIDQLPDQHQHGDTTRNSRPCRVSALCSPSALSMIALPMGRTRDVTDLAPGPGHLRTP